MDFITDILLSIAIAVVVILAGSAANFMAVKIKDWYKNRPN